MEIPSIARSLVDLFFPKRCLNCDSVITSSGLLCVTCASNLPYTHWHLDKNNFAYNKLKPLCKLKAAHSLLFFRHDNVTQKLLHNLKYNNHPEIGKLLAEKTVSEVNLDTYDGIIPVPVHPKKLRKRGYNQVVPYAETIAHAAGIPLIQDYLIRIENNSSQVTKNRHQRLNSIKNAFGLTNKKLSGNYILVDDVLTTGATVSTCVNLLRNQSGLKVSVLTIACGM
ncbi:MAG: double zinc ribbon domain-containing protein [Weeksellaceae bacterium]